MDNDRTNRSKRISYPHRLIIDKFIHTKVTAYTHNGVNKKKLQREEDQLGLIFLIITSIVFFKDGFLARSFSIFSAPWIMVV